MSSELKMSISAEITATAWSDAVVAWQQQAGRHHLPWQQDVTPYKVWVSEVMLQQTTVATVLDYFPRFMQAFPTVADLAQAPLDDVMALWSGLGYYRRAKHLHSAAGMIHQAWQGQWPHTVEALMQLPGVGRSTAGAILSLGMGRAASILDGNVKRVLARVLAVEDNLGLSRPLKALWAQADRLTPEKNTRSYNQGMMDLGAQICKRSAPLCNECPVHKYCQAAASGKAEKYPVKTKKIMVKKRRVIFLLCEYQGKVWLRKRDSSDIWADMWAFPAFEAKTKMQNFAKEKGLKTKLLCAFEHLLTHRKLQIEAYLAPWPANIVSTDCEGVWYNPFELAPGGLPQPVSRIIQLWQEMKS